MKLKEGSKQCDPGIIWEKAGVFVVHPLNKMHEVISPLLCVLH